MRSWRRPRPTRNRISTTKVRLAEYGNAWVKAAKDGEWKPVTAARFTADSNPVTNIDAGLTKTKHAFFLATGGETGNTNTKIGDIIILSKDAKLQLPKDMPVR